MIDNFTDIVLNFMPMHYGKYDPETNIGKLTQVIEQQWNDLAVTLNQIQTILDVDQASGHNLEIHASNKDILRAGLNDTELRDKIKLETRVNNSQGTLEEIVEISKIIFGEQFFGGIKESYDINGNSAEFRIKLKEVTDPTINIPNIVFERAIITAVAIDYMLENSRISLSVSKNEITYHIQKVLECGQNNSYCSSQMGVMF